MEGESIQNIPQINIPPSEIYRIHVLDNQGKIKRMYVFGQKSDASQPPGGIPSNMQTIFSEYELNEIKSKAIEVVFSSQQIHKDDSIRIIKKKIIQEIGEQEICYDEMYLFANVLEAINTISLYQLITQNDSRIITYEHLKQLLLNMNINEEITDRKEQYLYEDIQTWIEPHKKYPISIPIGQRFLYEHDYLFSCNPFKRVDSSIGGGDDVGAVDFIHNSLVTFDNQLLLNYGQGAFTPPTTNSFVSESVGDRRSQPCPTEGCAEALPILGNESRKRSSASPERRCKVEGLWCSEEEFGLSVIISSSINTCMLGVISLLIDSYTFSASLFFLPRFTPLLLVSVFFFIKIDNIRIYCYETLCCFEKYFMVHSKSVSNHYILPPKISNIYLKRH